MLHLSNEILSVQTIVRCPPIRSNQEAVDGLDCVQDHPQQWYLWQHENLQSKAHVLGPNMEVLDRENGLISIEVFMGIFVDVY